MVEMALAKIAANNIVGLANSVWHNHKKAINNGLLSPVCGFPPALFIAGVLQMQQ